MASVMNPVEKYTFPERRSVDKRQVVLQNICLQLASMGHKCQLSMKHGYLTVADSLLKNYSARRQLLAEYRSPVDQRIQDFLNDYLRRNGIEQAIKLPGETFSLNEAGLARELSLPYQGNHYKSELVESLGS